MYIATNLFHPDIPLHARLALVGLVWWRRGKERSRERTDHVEDDHLQGSFCTNIEWPCARNLLVVQCRHGWGSKCYTSGVKWNMGCIGPDDQSMINLQTFGIRIYNFDGFFSSQDLENTQIGKTHE
jgi:hypothetical protein